MTGTASLIRDDQGSALIAELDEMAARRPDLDFRFARLRAMADLPPRPLAFALFTQPRTCA